MQLANTLHRLILCFSRCLMSINFSGCRVSGNDCVEIHPAKAAGKVGMLTSLQLLLQRVPDVIVQGIPAVDRAVINKVKAKGKKGDRSDLVHICHEVVLITFSVAPKLAFTKEGGSQLHIRRFLPFTMSYFEVYIRLHTHAQIAVGFPTLHHMQHKR